MQRRQEMHANVKLHNCVITRTSLCQCSRHACELARVSYQNEFSMDRILNCTESMYWEVSSQAAQ
jgi:hypothetical protein